ncbi:MAG: aminotransferase class I/II-fold pyridoxal phosphate-dependent enzyme [Ignavibacteriaceae bacterium]|nr:aminotransferase class I/II-fold pyridoxal phosphate-dependent enzyme [Ignavibacteriaceae bacterium]
MITTADRLNNISEYYFSKKLKQIDDLNKVGKQIINLGIGSPDQPPHPDVIKTLNDESAKPNQHSYQNYRGAPALRNAMCSWYKKWYNVDLDPESEILPLIGSKEGIVHLCMTFLNPGDKVLVPNPGYPAYRAAVYLTGADCIDYELKEENNWMPDFSALESLDLTNVKMMWMNYPNMPTGQLPTIKLFERVIAFGKKHNILICHDNPYSFILNDKPLSLMSVPDAKETAVELNSLSKSHNMAGWRVGLLVGKASIINEVLRFKSNMDSGMFLPLQLAAAKALLLPDEWYKEVNNVYRSRRSKAFVLLESLETVFSRSQAGMFIWAKINDSENDCYTFVDKILDNARVFITPGGIFGSSGNRYIRISLCAPIEKLEEAIKRVGEMK